MSATSFQHLRWQEERGVLVVALLDENIQSDQGTEDLRRELVELAEQQRHAKWLLDFQRVRFFTSAGIRPMLALHRKLQGEQRRLVLCHLTPEIEEVFLATRLANPDRPEQGPFLLAANRDDAFRWLKHHETRLVDGVLVISLGHREMHGEELADDVNRELQAALQAGGSLRVVVDLERVEVMSTPCMRPLLQMRSWLKERGGKAVLCRLSPTVTEIFRITRMIPAAAGTPALFDAFPGVEDAVAAVKETR